MKWYQWVCLSARRKRIDSGAGLKEAFLFYRRMRQPSLGVSEASTGLRCQRQKCLEPTKTNEGIIPTAGTGTADNQSACRGRETSREVTGVGPAAREIMALVPHPGHHSIPGVSDYGEHWSVWVLTHRVMADNDYALFMPSQTQTPKRFKRIRKCSGQSPFSVN